MALFSRRLIHSRLNGIAHLLTWSNADHIVKRLNGPDMSAVSAEWEVVVTSILNELCEVKFEPILEGGRVADLLLRCGEDCVLADIAAVSNAGIRKLNPHDEFDEELRRRVTKRRISMSGFHTGIGSSLLQKGPKKRVSKYAIPAISEFREAFSPAFDKFLDDIRAAPDREHSFTFADPYKVKITRKLEGKYTTGSAPGYDAFDAYDTPIFSVVSRKREQIRGASKKYPIGIFLCDAGAQAFQQQYSSQFSLENIACRAFKRFRDVGFLVFLLADPARERPKGRRDRPRCVTVFNDQVAIPDAVKQVLNNIDARVPRAETRANDSNLWRRVKYLGGKEGARFVGTHSGVKFMDREHMYIKISSRSLLDVLTQKLPFEDFMRWNGFDRHAKNYGGGNPFHNLEGLTLKAARLEKCPDDDDDWLVFELEGNDPAVNAIINPVIKD
jgi:hypothetical protein